MKQTWNVLIKIWWKIPLHKFINTPTQQHQDAKHPVRNTQSLSNIVGTFLRSGWEVGHRFTEICRLHRPWPFAPEKRILLAFSHPAGGYAHPRRKRKNTNPMQQQTKKKKKKKRNSEDRNRADRPRHRRRISTELELELARDRLVMSLNISVFEEYECPCGWRQRALTPSDVVGTCSHRVFLFSTSLFRLTGSRVVGCN